MQTHEARGVGKVGADLAVNEHLALAEDPLGLGVCQRVLQAVADEDDQRQALAKLVGSSGRARGEAASQLGEHPVACAASNQNHSSMNFL